MPNHVINEVRLHKVSRNQAQPLIGTDKALVDFEVLLPLSRHFWPGSVGSDERTFFPGTQLQEAVEKWGTKWNAYGEPSVAANGDDWVLTFQTAWDHPRGWVCALFNALKCDITCEWLSEGSATAWREKYVWDDQFGPSWEKTEIAEKTHEHRRLHKLLWGVEEFEDDAA